MKDKKVSSTYLTHNTKKVIGMVKDVGAIYIHNYNQPVAVLVGYDEWQSMNQKVNQIKKKPTLDELKKFMFPTKDGKVVDSAKIIREDRDGE